MAREFVIPDDLVWSNCWVEYKPSRQDECLYDVSYRVTAFGRSYGWEHTRCMDEGSTLAWLRRRQELYQAQEARLKAEGYN